MGVVRYNVHRSTTHGFTPSAANRIAQPTGTSFTDTGLAAGTYYYRVTAEDAAGNLSAASNQATATVTGDTTPPTAPATLTATPGSGTATLGWSASTDNVGVVRYNVHRSTTNGFTPSAANRIAQPTGTSYADSRPRGRHLLLPRHRGGRRRQRRRRLRRRRARSSRTQPAGLVAAYGFDAGSGDGGRATRPGTATTARSPTARGRPTGKYGEAIQFNGTSTW